MQSESGAAHPPRDQRVTLVFWLLAAVLVLGGFLVRMQGYDRVVRSDGTIRFGDVDTMRRLERLGAIDAAASYPVREVKDGFPAGTVSHWTLPFDWCIRALDPVCRPFVAGAQRYEAGAILSGPVLGTLACLLFLWAAVRLLGRFGGWTAAAFYTLQFPLLAMAAAGNGDHQNLQHLALLAFGWLWVLERAGRVGSWAAPVSGLALGVGIWISTESMVAFLTWVVVTAVLALVRAPDRTELRSEQIRGGTLLLTLLVATWFEQADWSAIEWDKVSWFQLYPVLVFGAFLALQSVLAGHSLRVWIAAAVALGAGLLGLLTGFGTAVGAQLDAFARANVWLQTAVDEFRSSFWNGSEHTLAEGARRFTWLLPLLPVLFVAALARRPWQSDGRLVVAAWTAVGLGLAAWEVKLSHLFAIWFPVTMVAGARVLRDRWVPATRAWRLGTGAGFAGLLVVLGLAGRPTPPPQTIQGRNQGIAELCGYLERQRGRQATSVLAPWDQAGAILYRAGWPVVASGYHRNLAGIHDGYRFYSCQPDEAAIAAEILRRRKVRFVVAWYSRVFLQKAQTVLGSGREFIAQRGNQSLFTELARNSLFWRLRYRDDVPGFRLRYNSNIQITLGSSKPEPLFKVFEVVR